MPSRSLLADRDGAVSNINFGGGQEMTRRNHQEVPSVAWDGAQFLVSLPVEGRVLDATLTPRWIYTVCIRETSEQDWSPGFVTPFTHCSLTGLKPDTEYELQVVANSKKREVKYPIGKARTTPEGNLPSNVIPFPTQKK